MIIKSVKEFKALDGFNKGFIVYIRGAHKDEPFVPLVYTPTTEEKSDYEKGSSVAMIDTRDSNG